MIGIMITATNNYFPLGLRFVHRYLRFSKQAEETLFFFFSEKDPSEYLKQHESTKVIWIKTEHSNWLEGVNNRFKNTIDFVFGKNIDYIYNIDSDTNFDKSFELPKVNGIVAGEHFGNNSWMKDRKNYDRNPQSMSYVPENTQLPQMYYLGAFWGGEVSKVKEMCATLYFWQVQDKTINYEPGVNDESYLNKYLHYNPPNYTILYKDFPMMISCKGGIQNIRYNNPAQIEKLLKDIKIANNWNILNGVVQHD
ncbi:MAG: hypothetical protein ACK6DA_09710 [Candidatus Kapaibacterium sp.]